MYIYFPTGIRVCGALPIAWLQESIGARIYYNTLVPFNGALIKYGVISTKHLVSDLNNWDTLYVSGRLHKQVWYGMVWYGMVWYGMVWLSLIHI